MNYLEKVYILLKSVIRKLKTQRYLQFSSNKTFLEDAYREILGRDIDQDGLNSYTRLLEAGYSRTYVLMSIVKSDEFINKVLRENNSAQNLKDAIASNKTFLEDAYREILGRDIDQDGLNSYTRLLEAGYSRTYVLMSIVKSDEFLNKVLRENNPIQNLRELRPSSYHLVDDISQTNQILLFNERTRDDFDWLESMIIENGYYEKPGVWGYSIDLDKKIMAEIMLAFKPSRALEIGCANGTIMQCLHELIIFCKVV